MTRFLLPFLLANVSSAASVRGSDPKNNDGNEARSLRIQGACTGASLRPILASNKDFRDALNSFGSSNTEIEAALDEICSNPRRQLQETSAIPFGEVTSRGYHFDKNYFDGGTSWNDGLYSTKEIDAGRVDQIASTLQQKQLEWPDIVNFQNCDLKAVMCCFTEEQDSTTTPITNSPTTSGNSDVCHHDMRDSPRASHTQNGLTIYTDGRNTFENTNDAYCTGFTWDHDDATSLETLFRANTLFRISMYEGFYKNNRVGNIPGAPMCGCVEQMPIVTKSACVKPVESTEVTGSRGRKLVVEKKVDFVQCNVQDDLVAHYETTHSMDTNSIAALKKIIVGNDKCPLAVDKLIAPLSYTRGDVFWHANPDKWSPIAGQNFLYHPDVGVDEFNKLFDASPTKIIRRICKSCAKTHRDIYYRRITALPDGMNLLEYLKNSWLETNNVMGVDFELYSTYDEAVARSGAWTFCNYSSNQGFPFECGPTEKVTKQWTSFKSTSNTYAKHTAFYIDMKA